MKEMAKHIPDAGSYAPVTILVAERPETCRMPSLPQIRREQASPDRWHRKIRRTRSGAIMNGTEIRRLNAEDAAEYQAVFLEALQSAPAAFAADYDEESARSSDQIAERFRREVVFGYLWTAACVQSQHSCSNPPQSGGTSE